AAEPKSQNTEPGNYPAALFISGFSTQNIVGMSHRIESTIRLIDQIRPSSVDVLVQGESGTGKELIAKALHFNSPRAKYPFIAVNCAALPDALVEAELFGIEKGVATGVERRIGKFEAAHEGTLFLDEIGDLSLTAQAKLLRVLQERVVEHVGGRKPIPVDVRTLSATNKNLEAEIKKGTFREDLYYRLKVIHVQMPPLREIPEDIPGLANYLLATYCREMKMDPVNLTPEAASACMDYHWPGNVRELENEMKRLVLSVSGNTVGKRDLSEAILNSSGTEVAPSSTTPRFIKHVVSEVEKRMIQEALQQSKQNQLHAARTLGLSRHGLIKKMKRYNIRL